MDIKGTAVIAIRDFVKQNYGNKYDEWIRNLSEESQNIFNETIDSSAWYPVESGAIEPTRKIGELFYNNNPAKGAWESGRYSAHKALHGIYKIFVKASSPNYIIQRASRVFATYYRPCTMSVVDKKEKGVTLRINSPEKNDEVLENRIAGWIENALEISGADDVHINTDHSEDNDAYLTDIKISWQ